MWGCELESLHLEWGPVEESCDHGNEPVGAIKCWEFLDQLSDLASQGLSSV
jgi:hypothetical protein